MALLERRLGAVWGVCSLREGRVAPLPSPAWFGGDAFEIVTARRGEVRKILVVSP